MHAAAADLWLERNFLFFMSAQEFTDNYIFAPSPTDRASDHLPFFHEARETKPQSLKLHLISVRALNACRLVYVGTYVQHLARKHCPLTSPPKPADSSSLSFFEVISHNEEISLDVNRKIIAEPSPLAAVAISRNMERDEF